MKDNHVLNLFSCSFIHSYKYFFQIKIYIKHLTIKTQSNIKSTHNKNKHSIAKSRVAKSNASAKMGQQ